MGWLLPTILAITVVVFGLLIYWLTGVRYKAGVADATADALKAGRQQRSKADAVMAETVADESAWLRRARERAERLRDADRDR